MKKYFFLVLFVVSIFYNLKIFSEENILQGVTENIPFLNYEDDQGNVKGTVAEDVNQIFQKMHQPIKISVFKWAYAYEKAKNNKNYFIYPIGKTPDREKDFIFAGVIYISESFFYAKSDQNIQIHSVEDAKKYPVCVVRNDIKHKYLVSKNFPKLVLVPEVESLYTSMMQNKCELILGAATFDLVVQKYSKDKSVPMIRRVFTADEIRGERYLAFQKDTDPELIQKFKVAILKWQESKIKK